MQTFKLGCVQSLAVWKAARRMLRCWGAIMPKHFPCVLKIQATLDV